MHQGTKGAAVRGESVVKVDAEEQNRAFRIQWNSAVSIYACIHYYYFSGIGTSFLLLPFPFSTISPFVSSPRGQHTRAFAARPPATLRTTEAPHFPSAGLCTEPCSPLHSPRLQPPQCTAMQALPSPPPAAAGIHGLLTLLQQRWELHAMPAEHTERLKALSSYPFPQPPSAPSPQHCTSNAKVYHRNKNLQSNSG